MYFINIVNIYNETQSSKYIEYHALCVGYYAQLEDAIQAITNNSDNIHKSIYNYAVIEQIDQGIHIERQKEIWFKWNDEYKHYEPADKPREIKNIVNISFE